MSLEDKVAELTGAIQVLTDALQQHAVALRALTANVKLPESLPQAPGKLATSPPSTAEVKSNKPGPKPKIKETPPPAPLAVDDTAGTPASAPAAVGGSEAAGDDLLAYDDLKEVVPQVGEEISRAKVLSIYAELGAANGMELQAKADKAKDPTIIHNAVLAFRAALEAHRNGGKSNDLV